MNSNETNYKWEYSEFTTAIELKKFVDEIKPILIGEKIKSLFITSDNHYGTFIDGYNMLKDNENVSIDVAIYPSILKTENHTLIFNMYSGSDLEISLDKNIEILNSDITYCEISSLFAKNVVGQRIVDISIDKISKYDAAASDSWYPESIHSDDMFSSLIFKLENGHEFIITIIFDNTGIIER